MDHLQLTTHRRWLRSTAQRVHKLGSPHFKDAMSAQLFCCWSSLGSGNHGAVGILILDWCQARFLSWIWSNDFMIFDESTFPSIHRSSGGDITDFTTFGALQLWLSGNRGQTKNHFCASLAWWQVSPFWNVNWWNFSQTSRFQHRFQHSPPRTSCLPSEDPNPWKMSRTTSAWKLGRR